MPASNFANAIQKGLSFKSTQEKNRLARQQDFLNLDNQRKGALFQDSRVVNSLLKSGQPEQALNVLSNRMNVLEQVGGDSSDTREVADFIARGDIQGAVNLLDSVEAAGVQGGFLPDQRLAEAKIKAAGGVSSEQRSFEKMISGLTPKEQELAKRIKLGLSPRAVGSSAQTISQDKGLTQDVATSQAIIESAKETGKLESQFKLKPKISKAVALATGEANLIADNNKLAKSNSKALAVYDAAYKGLSNAFENAYTGPVAGLMPALTSSAQIANASVAMAAPTLKKVFRESGEGTFTDQDQKMLTDMLPTRQDKPATIKWKMNAIDSIVRSKLTSNNEQATPNQQAQAQQAAEPIDKQGGQIMIDANGNKAMVFPDGTFKEL